MQQKADDFEDLEDGLLYEHFRITVDKGQSSLRIDKYLGNRLEGTSRNRIQSAADAGSVMVNNVPVKSNYKIKPEDEITIMLDFPKREIELIPEDIPLNVVYEDESVLVINKEPGLVVHPGTGNYTGTLVNALVYRYKDDPFFGTDDPRPGLVHRIDKDTSGLLVIAKTDIAKTKLSLQFFEKTSKRTYQALVWGTPKENEGTIEGNIGRSLKNRQVFNCFPDGDFGKEAITHYKVLESFGYVSLIECRLETGRTHQIRVHLKYLGHPLFNDANYGGDQILKGTTYTKYKQFVNNCFAMCPRQALHAKTLGFVHPVSGEELLFDSELPADMSQLITKWRNYISNRPLDEPDEIEESEND